MILRAHPKYPRVTYHSYKFQCFLNVMTRAKEFCWLSENWIWPIVLKHRSLPTTSGLLDNVNLPNKFAFQTIMYFSIYSYYYTRHTHTKKFFVNLKFFFIFYTI